MPATTGSDFAKTRQTNSRCSIRAAPLPDNDNLFYVEFYGLGWRQKIRLNRSTAKFEKTPGDPEFAFPEGYWQVDSFRTLRFTFAQTAGGDLSTKLYLDGNAEAFGEGLSDEEKDGGFVDVGRAGGTDYGAYFDYLAINPRGAFAPDDRAAPAPPADLIVPDVVVSTAEVNRGITSLPREPQSSHVEFSRKRDRHRWFDLPNNRFHGTSFARKRTARK